MLKKQKNRHNINNLMLASAMALASTSANAIDVDAGDYEAAAPGTNVGLLYLQQASRNESYTNGNRNAGDNGLDSSIGILRAVHFTTIGGMTADPQILIPFGRLEGKDDMAKPLGSNNGFGDPILASTFWVQNDPKNRVYTGITPYLYVPIGSYDKKEALNLGENRWKYNLQFGHVRPLSENVSLDLIGDVMFFGDNTDYGTRGQTLEQKPLIQAQAWLRYHLTPTADLRFLASKTFGGETEVDGASQNDRTSTTKLGIGGSLFIGPKTQILAIAGRDIDVDNGFKEEARLNIRILQLF